MILCMSIYCKFFWWGSLLSLGDDSKFESKDLPRVQLTHNDYISHLLFLGSTALVISFKLEIKFFAFASILEGAWEIKLDARFVPIYMCQEKGFQGTCDEYSSSYSNWEFLLFVAFLELELASFIHGVFEKPGIHNGIV